MRFLADKNISYRLCTLFDNAGYQAAHVDQFLLGAAEDAAILDFARSGEWVVISSDTDFGTLLAAQRATTPSVILTREVSRLPAEDLAMAAETPAAEAPCAAVDVLTSDLADISALAAHVGVRIIALPL